MRRYLVSRKISPRNWFQCFPVYADCFSGLWIPDSLKITIMFFILVPFLKRAPYIIIYFARTAERREEAYGCQSFFQHLNHSFICLSPFPDSVSGFRLFHTPRFEARTFYSENLMMV